VGLGEPVEMRHLETGVTHLREYGGGGRRGGGEEANEVRKRSLLGFARVEQDRNDDRGAAEEIDFMLGDRIEQRLGPDLAQADMDARLDADRPGKTPAVAMEHRQGPEIDGMRAHVRGDDVAEREQAGAAMMVDDALGIARRPRSVIESYRVPFVERRGADVGFVSLRDEVLIFDLA